MYTQTRGLRHGVNQAAEWGTAREREVIAFGVPGSRHMLRRQSGKTAGQRRGL